MPDAYDASKAYGQMLLLYGKVIARAWRDPAFQDRLTDRDPGRVRDALAEEGIRVPSDMTVRVLVDAPSVFHLVIPQRPTVTITEFGPLPPPMCSIQTMCSPPFPMCSWFPMCSIW